MYLLGEVAIVLRPYLLCKQMTQNYYKSPLKVHDSKV